MIAVNDLFEDFDDIADLAEALDDPAPGARIMAVIELTDTADPAKGAVAQEPGTAAASEAVPASTNGSQPEAAASATKEKKSEGFFSKYVPFVGKGG